MAAEEGGVIGCHTSDKFNEHLEKVKDSEKLIVIDFTASWCGPCRFIAPILADIAKKTPHVLFLKVDVDELKDVAEKYNVEAMPTFVFLKKGEEVHRIVGGKKEELLAKINELGTITVAAA